MPSTIQVQLKINNDQLVNGLTNTIRTKLNSALHLAAIDATRDLKSLISNLLTASPEYESLRSGILKQDFALQDPEIALNDILTTLQRGVFVDTYPVSFNGLALTGGINVKMIRSDFTDLLSLANVKYQDVDWLRWLLTGGDSVIMMGATFVHPLNNKNASLQPNKGFRVPPQFAGTTESNWITKTFDTQKIQGMVFNILSQAIQRRI